MEAKYDLKRIREAIVAALNPNELRTFCYDYFPDFFETISHNAGKPEIALGMIDHCKRRDRIPQLVELLKKNHPHVFANNNAANRTYFDLRDFPQPPHWEPFKTYIEDIAGLNISHNTIGIIELRASSEHLVGINLYVTSLIGQVEFRYKVLYSHAAKPNLGLHVIPAKHGIVIGEVDGNRVRFDIPSEHIGDGKWHDSQPIDYDFRHLPAAYQSIIAPRINEGYLDKGAAYMLIDSLRVNIP